MAKFQVTVTSTSREKVILLIQTLRAIGDLGLAEANALSDYLTAAQPCVLAAGLDAEVADHILVLLQAAGAHAEVDASDLTAPLFLCPPANHKSRWISLRGRVQVD